MKKKKHFLRLPEFPGGKDEFQKYILDNLIYPKSATEHNIQGTVHLSADVDDEGNVSGIRIDKGIGFGCDEEAVRLIEGIRFGGVSNRGLRVKSRKKFRIQFKQEKRPESEKVEFRIQYEYKETESESKISKKSDHSTGKQISYSYRVQIG
jgi:TonB family protein